jgi:hypothetical protein
MIGLILRESSEEGFNQYERIGEFKTAIHPKDWATSGTNDHEAENFQKIHP